MHENKVILVLIWCLPFNSGIPASSSAFFLVSTWYNTDWALSRSATVNTFSKEALHSEIFTIFLIRDLSPHLKSSSRLTTVPSTKALLESAIRSDFGTSNISVNLLHCMITLRAFKAETWMKDLCIS